jgi:hypothetical protein
MYDNLYFSKNKEFLMLISSAILKDNKIYIGKRHNNIFSNYSEINLKNGIQGFIDENSKFYNREEAKVYAIKIKQIKEDKMISTILTSEDLW